MYQVVYVIQSTEKYVLFRFRRHVSFRYGGNYKTNTVRRHYASFEVEGEVFLEFYVLVNVRGRSACVRNVICRRVLYLVEAKYELVYKIKSANSGKSLVVYVRSAYYVVCGGYRYYVFPCVPFGKVEVEGRGGSLGRTVEDVVRILVVCTHDTERIRTRVFYRSPFYSSVVCGNGDTLVAFPHSVKFAVRFDLDSVYVFTGQFCRIVRIAHPPAHKAFAQLRKIIQYAVVRQ